MPANKAEEMLTAPVTAIENYDKPGSSKLLTNILRILALFAVVAITVYIFSIRERVEQFAAFGYPGIFLIALLPMRPYYFLRPGWRLFTPWEPYLIHSAWG